MLHNSRFVFFGSPRFAEVVLQKLVEGGYPPSLVVCNPDRPVGRKKTLTPPPVKQRIMNYDSRIKNRIEIIQPEKIDKNLESIIVNLESSFAIIAAYSKIIPKAILDCFPLGVIGVHPSLLPRHRGPSPIQTALLEGDETTGVTLFLTDEK